MNKKLWVPLLTLVTTASFPALSQQVAVLNHAFEFDRIPFDAQKTEGISGWVSSGNGDAGVEVPLGGGFTYNGFDNLSQAGFLEQGGRISQALNLRLLKGETYTLNYTVGRPLGEDGHSVVARIKANGLVLAQKQTHGTSLAAGTWTDETLTFTATENMPLGESVALEFYNPKSKANAKAHIDNVQLAIKGTGQAVTVVSEKFKDAVIENIVATDLTINIPEDFINLPVALSYLQDKVISPDKNVTLNMNDCGAFYPSPIHIDHPQGDQLSIVGANTSCRIVFGSADGFVVSTALKRLQRLDLIGSNLPNGAGIKTINAGNIFTLQDVEVANFETGVKNNAKSYMDHINTLSRNNLQTGFRTEFGGVLELNKTASNDNLENGYHANNGGIFYAVNTPKGLNNPVHGILVEDAAYEYVSENKDLDESRNNTAKAAHLSVMEASNYFYNSSANYRTNLFSTHSSLIYSRNHSSLNYRTNDKNSYGPVPYN